ncbi:hypothetical protein L210DRAFT_3199255 [Boletus edulis BED1]|uniref:Uncharacterized protein n=1 Tax=Boletus edulis BED1 TaxID=1328754 RepID=A0AAD4GFN4_BOLED|nr:hypothetical protein L210DRAFT_3199255 [Boletus edulis BED1]
MIDRMANYCDLRLQASTPVLLDDKTASYFRQDVCNFREMVWTPQLAVLPRLRLESWHASLAASSILFFPICIDAISIVVACPVALDTFTFLRILLAYLASRPCISMLRARSIDTLIPLAYGLFCRCRFCPYSLSVLCASARPHAMQFRDSSMPCHCHNIFAARIAQLIWKSAVSCSTTAASNDMRAARTPRVRGRVSLSVSEPESDGRVY